MAFAGLETVLPNFDEWVELREKATPAKAGPAVYIMQDGKGVRFIACKYKDGLVETKTLVILNADKALYEWNKI